MSVVTRPRHPLVDTALDLARTWCAGHIIDDAPALGHAIRVALTLGRHLPAAPTELIACSGRRSRSSAWGGYRCKA